MRGPRRFYVMAAIFTIFVSGAVARASDHGARAVDLVTTCASAFGAGVAVGAIAASRRSEGAARG
jgi:hypothetical protein